MWTTRNSKIKTKVGKPHFACLKPMTEAKSKLHYFASMNLICMARKPIKKIDGSRRKSLLILWIAFTSGPARKKSTSLGSSWRGLVLYLWRYLWRSPWCPQGVPWKSHQWCCHLRRVAMDPASLITANGTITMMRDAAPAGVNQRPTDSLHSHNFQISKKNFVQKCHF